MQSADGDAQTLTEVDLFISTQRIKVLNADSQVRDSKHTYIMFLFFYQRVLFSPARMKVVYPFSASATH